MADKLYWTPKLFKLSDLKLWDKNPRTISLENFERLKQKITTQGFHNLIVLDTNCVVISGNQRKRALDELGISEVFCMIPNRVLTETEMLEVAISSNIQDGGWDYDMLSAQMDIEKLKELGLTESQLKINPQPDVINDISLPNGEKGGLEQITFTLTKDQMDTVKSALKTANDLGEYYDTGNENKNGNALARICEDYKSYGE
jgi:hypothetical protein